MVSDGEDTSQKDTSQKDVYLSACGDLCFQNPSDHVAAKKRSESPVPPIAETAGRVDDSSPGSSDSTEGEHSCTNNIYDDSEDEPLCEAAAPPNPPTSDQSSHQQPPSTPCSISAPTSQSTSTVPSLPASTTNSITRNCKCQDVISLTTWQVYTSLHFYRKPIWIFLLIFLILYLITSVLDYVTSNCYGVECTFFTRLDIVIRTNYANVLILAWNALALYLALFKSQSGTLNQEMTVPKCDSCGKALTTEKAFARELANSKNTKVVKEVTKFFVSPLLGSKIENQLKHVKKEFHEQLWKCLVCNIVHTVFVGLSLWMLATRVSLVDGLQILFLLLWMFIMQFILSIYGTEMYVKRYVMRFCKSSIKSSSPSLHKSAKDVIDCISNRWWLLELGMTLSSCILALPLLFRLSLLFEGLPRAISVPLSSDLSKVSSTNWLCSIVCICVGHLFINSFFTYMVLDVIGFLIEFIALVVLKYCSESPLNFPVALLVPSLNLYFLLVFFFWFQLERSYRYYTKFQQCSRWYKVTPVIYTAAYGLLVLLVGSLNMHYEHTALRHGCALQLG